VEGTWLRCRRLVSRQSRRLWPRPRVVRAFRSGNALAQRFGDSGVGWLELGENRRRRDPGQQYSPMQIFRGPHRQFSRRAETGPRGSARGLCCAAEVSERFSTISFIGRGCQTLALRGERDGRRLSATRWQSRGASVGPLGEYLLNGSHPCSYKGPFVSRGRICKPGLVDV
jgi:hypothetical protein